MTQHNQIIERVVTIVTADGPMKTFVAQPLDVAPVAAAVMIQHIGGLSLTMTIVARRVAALGVACVVPALYHRLGDIVVDPVDSDPSVAAIRAVAVASVTPTRLETDIAATLEWLDAQPGVLPGARAVIGFGGGAGQAMRLATTFPERFRALVGILGVGYVRDDPNSPHLGLPRFAGAAYFGFAGDDAIVPAAAIDRLRAALHKAGVAHDCVVHPDVGHGYLFANRDAYCEHAAEADWAAVARLFATTLPTAKD